MGILGWIKETATGPVAWAAVIGSYIAIFIALGYVSYLNTSERDRAINDFCTVQEQRHLDDVTELARTYQYLDQLTEAQVKDSFNQAIIQFLPQTEEDAKNDTAPVICDDTYQSGVGGVLFSWGEEKPYGLPEPDPEIPKRPPGIEDLVASPDG